MFGRKKPERPKRDRSGNLAQFGLFDVPADFQPMGGSVDSDGGDSDLEAELAALTGGGSHRPQPKKDIDAAVEDEEVDEDDPALLSELQEITGEEVAEEEPAPPTAAVSAEVVDTLAARLKAYQELEKAAREAGEISKAKRFGRALKTLSDLLKTARAGGPVDLSDSAVPPEIQPKPSAGNHAKEQAAEVQKAVDEELLAMLLARQKEYKLAALQAKKGGNSELAINHLKIAKVFDHVIEAVKRGEAVDLSDMPGPPGEPRIQENERQQSGNTDNAPEPQPLQAGTIEEALQQRLEFYKAHEQQAKDEANSSKARRFGRIVKQFEQALKAHRAGKGVEFEELPTPPGFAAIPVPGAPPAAPPTTREAPPIPKPSPSRAQQTVHHAPGKAGADPAGETEAVQGGRPQCEEKGRTAAGQGVPQAGQRLRSADRSRRGRPSSRLGDHSRLARGEVPAGQRVRHRDGRRMHGNCGQRQRPAFPAGNTADQADEDVPEHARPSQSLGRCGRDEQIRAAGPQCDQGSGCGASGQANRARPSKVSLRNQGVFDREEFHRADRQRTGTADRARHQLPQQQPQRHRHLREVRVSVSAGRAPLELDVHRQGHEQSRVQPDVHRADPEELASVPARWAVPQRLPTGQRQLEAAAARNCLRAPRQLRADGRPTEDRRQIGGASEAPQPHRHPAGGADPGKVAHCRPVAPPISPVSAVDADAFCIN
ncbi:hypothetical protein D910_08125 [Dendroctonus ponderosae]|uniref:DM14 domain-containing protein n=1 Tax=Dendroctonus ponderosae TaxID=77166 RepID=U4UA12_DENPD|nr:hypothetical protein D910_08125 [Dendroctonus ponderosae]